MYGDKWWGSLSASGVVTITQQDPSWPRQPHVKRWKPVKVVGPFAEDLADELEGDNKMVRRRILAAIYDKPLEEIEDKP